jgi:Domain of unknown function (DUF4190)
MAFALTCTCGARLEIDDKFAGQAVACPDCQKPLHMSASEQTGRRTSGLALVSIILALVGAFTIVGTVAAVLFGAMALRQIGRHSDRLAGRGYAIAGIVLGVIMTAGTVFALSSVELFGLTAMIGDGGWADKLDYDGPLEVVREQEGFAIKRPSSHWGVYKPPWTRAGGDLNQSAWDDLLLMQPADDAVVLCFAVRVGPDYGIDQCREKFERDFPSMEKVGLFKKTGKNVLRNMPTTKSSTKQPWKQGDTDLVEMQIDKRAGKEDKSFLVRILKARGDDRMFVVIGGSRRNRFPRLEGSIRQAIDSFRLLSRDNRIDW